MRGGQATAKVQLDFLLPDTLLKKEVQTLPGNIGQVISSFLLKGDETWSDVQTSSSKIPILRSEGAAAENERQALLRHLRKDMALYPLQLLLIVPAIPGVELIYVGEAEAPDGKADVIDVKGVSGLTVRLFFDKKSHRLLLMSFTEPLLERLPRTRAGADREGGEEDSQVGEVAKVQFHFSDYRAEGDIIIPHLITHVRNGKVIAERRLTSFNPKPAFKPDHFEAKRKS
jgi:hypothetical protein